MKARILAVQFLLGGSLLAQSANVFISDSNGNQATGTISGGNVFFHDSHSEPSGTETFL